MARDTPACRETGCWIFTDLIERTLVNQLAATAVLDRTVKEPPAYLAGG